MMEQMTNRLTGTDRIYLAACNRDARLTRICVASIRFFYPEIPIQILPGDYLQSGLSEELKRYWNVDMADIPEGDYGWGLVKLEPLFGPPGLKFMVVDVDTVFTGRVLDRRAESGADFFVDNEQLSDDDFRRLYFNWTELEKIDSKTQSAKKSFNAGEWFGTAGIVKREEFDRWVEWTMPRCLRYPDIFMGGDQGVMNHVVLKKEAFDGVSIDRVTLMRWPGNGMEDLDVESVRNGTAPALVVHWAGMKHTLLRNTAGEDLLRFFEDFYYTKIPQRRLRRSLDIVQHVWIQEWYRFSLPWKLRLRKWLGKSSGEDLVKRTQTKNIKS